MKSLTEFACTILVLVGLCGCQDAGKPGTAVDLQPVSGKVLMDDKPLAGALVSFVPRTAAGQVSTGVSDAEGNFECTYPDGKKGVPLGEFKVYFSKLVMPSGEPIPEGQTAADVNARNLVPMKYNNPDDQINVVTVPVGGLKDLVFELKSK